MRKREALKEARELAAEWTTENLLTHPQAARLVTVTPVQRAICRMVDGIDLGELWDDAQVRLAFSGAKPPPVAPKTAIVLCGTRGAKSLISACKAVRASLFCDLEGLGEGDEVMTPVLATSLKNARAVFSHTKALCYSKAIIGRLVGEPKGESLTLAHIATGRDVEISCTAASKHAGNLVSRWLATCIFDEAPRLAGEDEGKLNLDDARRAIPDRIRPGGFEGLIGSPWAPYGPVFDLVRDHEGRPSEEVMVVRATGPMLNPYWWTPERCDELRKRDPFAYQTSCLAQFADPENALIPTELLAKATDSGWLEKPALENDPYRYVAAMDPATRGNAWTLVVFRCVGVDANGRHKLEQVRAEQWIGRPKEPLSPKKTLEEIKLILAQYDLAEVMTDQLALDFIADIAESIGLAVLGYHVGPDDKMLMCEQIRQALVEDRLRLLDCRQQFADLQRVKKRPTTNGVTIQLPVSGDSRHCDFVPAVGLCMLFPPDPPAGVRLSQENRPRPKKRLEDTSTRGLARRVSN